MFRIRWEILGGPSSLRLAEVAAEVEAGAEAARAAEGGGRPRRAEAAAPRHRRCDPAWPSAGGTDS